MDVVILGAGGDSSVVAEAIRAVNRAGGELRLVGLLDDNPTAASSDGPILGTLTDWSTVASEVNFIPALHRYGLMEERHRLLAGLSIPPERWVSVIHPMSCISSSASIGRGSFIASFVTIQPGATIGSFVSIRAGANIGHDTNIGDFAYVGPNATTCGYSAMGDGSHLGPNGVLRGFTTMHSYSLAGIGAVVVNDVARYATVAGNPARELAARRDEP